MHNAFSQYLKAKDMSHQSVPSDYYNDDYYAHMAPGNFRYFVENRGRVLTQARLDDLALVKLRPGQRLLDLGCGRGELVMYCGSVLGIDAYGVDYSETAILLGAQCLVFYTQAERQRIHLLRACVTNLPFPDSYFDRVMSWSVVEHLHQWQLEACLAEVYRVLKPDGILVLGTHPNEWYEKVGYRLARPVKSLLLGKRMDSYREMKAKDFGHVNVKNPWALRRDLQKQRFYCEVRLLPRREYEINNGLGRAMGACLERIPVLRLVFCSHILAIGAKICKMLQRFVIN